MACVRFLRRRGPAGLRDLFLLLSELWLVHPALRTLCVYEVGVVSLPSARFACCRNAGRTLVKTTHLPFSWSGYFFVDFSGINYAPIRNLENLKTILIFSITCGMVVLLEIKPLHRSYYVGKLQKTLEADDRQKSQQN